MNPSNKKDTADVTSDVLTVPMLSAHTTEGLNKNLKTIYDEGSLSMQNILNRNNIKESMSVHIAPKHLLT